jgi:predicted Zn-dependent peptidase
MLISSGIEKENYEKTLKIIRRELKKMTQKVDDKELENAKSEVLTSIDSIYDNSIDIIYYYFGMEVLESDNIEEKKKKFMSVTIEDLLNFANKVKIDTVLLLYGSDKNEETTN